MKPGLPTEPALVGRDGEIEQLLRHLESASNRKVATAFVFGDAGIGKTRLIRVSNPCKENAGRGSLRLMFE